MKATIAIVTFIVALSGTCLMAGDTKPAPASVEQQFQQADIQLAVEQYKKLRMAAFDLEFKLQTETVQSDEQRKQLQDVSARLNERAEELRVMTVKRAEVALAASR